MPAQLAPIDESVPIPESVKRAAALADQAHKQAYNTPDPTPEPPKETPPADDKLVQLSDTPAPDPTPPPAPEPTPAPEPAPTPAPAVTPEQWEHRYHSMRGRYEQAASTIGTMQEQMQQLGDELMRTQALLQTRAAPPPPAQPKKLITDEDVKTYGPELLDVVSRAAEEAVSPKLSALEQENLRLRQQVQQQSQRTVHETLDEQVPNWREINKSPRFLQWLGLPDVYSRTVRRQLLNAAFQAADAPRVLAFFKGFINDEVATGQMTAPTAQPAATSAPRQAAVSLESIAAPGRARPATGDTQVPVDKPIFTRNQIADFYTRVRQGQYNGRDQDKMRDEAAIFAAQREGRVR